MTHEKNLGQKSNAGAPRDVGEEAESPPLETQPSLVKIIAHTKPHLKPAFWQPDVWFLEKASSEPTRRRGREMDLPNSRGKEAALLTLAFSSTLIFSAKRVLIGTVLKGGFPNEVLRGCVCTVEFQEQSWERRSVQTAELSCSREEH